MPADARQRWRVVYARDETSAGLAQRAEIEAWEAGLAASGLPLVTTESSEPKVRVAFAAPLPVGMTAAGELLELLTSERLPVHQVRRALVRVAPPGHRIVAVHDVWLGAPPLPGQVVGAEYRVRLAAVEPALLERLAGAIRALLSAERLERERRRGERAVRYDLRPFVVGLTLEGDAGAPILWMRLAHDPERGIGRPDEVVAALSDLVGEPLGVEAACRERIVLAEDDGARRAPGGEPEA
jgi:radical SAM-linked protein